MMSHILDKNIPEDGYVLIVNARDGLERKAIHKWAEEKGLKHSAFVAPFFNSGTMIRCNNCRYVAYDFPSDGYDFGDFSGGCMGIWTNCPACGNHALVDGEEDEDSPMMYVDSLINSVIIGKELPKLPRRKKGKRFKEHTDDNVPKLPEKPYFELVKMDKIKMKRRWNSPTTPKIEM